MPPNAMGRANRRAAPVWTSYMLFTRAKLQFTYRRLMRVGCGVSRGTCGAHGGRISHWLKGVSPTAPRSSSIDAVPPNTGLLCCDVTPNRGTTRTTFTLTTVSRVSWSRPVGPLKHNNTILSDLRVHSGPNFMVQEPLQQLITIQMMLPSSGQMTYFCSEAGGSRFLQNGDM